MSVSGAFLRHANGGHRPIKVMTIFDSTGTVFDDEGLIRSAIQEVMARIVHYKGNTVDDAIEEARRATHQEQTEFLAKDKSEQVRETVDKIMNPRLEPGDGRPIIDWTDFWTPVEGRQYGPGAGNLANYRYFCDLGLIPDSIDFAMFDSMILARYYGKIASGELRLRPGIKEAFNYVAANRDWAGACIATKDTRELMQLKILYTQMGEGTDALPADHPIEFYVCQDDDKSKSDSKTPIYMLTIEEAIRRNPGYNMVFLVIEDTEKGLEGAYGAEAQVRLMGHNMNCRIHYPFSANDRKSRFATHTIDPEIGEAESYIINAINELRSQNDNRLLLDVTMPAKAVGGDFIGPASPRLKV